MVIVGRVGITIKIEVELRDGDRNEGKELGGFCLCHLEGKLFSWKRPFTAKVGQIGAQGLCWQISILPGGLLGKTLLPYSEES